MKSTTPVSKIKTEFSLQNATSFGGIKVFLAYLEKIKLAEAMHGRVQHSPSSRLPKCFVVPSLLLGADPQLPENPIRQ
ncbi:hypothetical protein [Aneurinibacillus aneurinilyticus]|uniref:Uncharacterized protein n=1 Tax=Aneurinibacillus aneurinilyticus TaxID=1391 RepID=A0A848D5S9_ANEAE|nr:hypothetical protein [Aneurinibacillus aneurinilyticus]MED0670997.1 hypothetical protein [Aneurinibacillus aneurinilyticus]NMF01081.1 hypothetical protein [Aneurinibacillus aneurinilyticus]